MEHIHRDINKLVQFEVTLEHDSLPIPDSTFNVHFNNDANQIYLHDPRWMQFIEFYRMEPGTMCHLYMDGIFENTYFYYKDRTYSYSSDGEYHDVRDANGLISHYPHAESEPSVEYLDSYIFLIMCYFYLDLAIVLSHGVATLHNVTTSILVVMFCCNDRYRLYCMYIEHFVF
jgi:hypothetical protein